ncbi:hypothetical protein GCM10023075_16360 [Streptosporangium album]
MVSSDTCMPRRAYETEAGERPVAFATSRIVARFRGWGIRPAYASIPPKEHSQRNDGGLGH